MLGLRPLEENLDAIEHATDRQMAHLRTFQSGKHSQFSQKLLNEVAAAKVTLLNPEKKTDYDRSVCQRLKPKADPSDRPSKTAPLPMAAPLPDEPQATPASGTAKAGMPKQQIMIAAGAGVGVLVLLLALLLIFAGGGSDEAPAEELAIGTDPSAAGQAVPSATADVGSPSPAQPDIPPVAPEPATRSETEPPLEEALAAAPSETPEQPDVEGPMAQLPAAEPPPKPKHPIPTPQEQQRILAALDDVFDLSKQRSNAEKIKVAGELLNLGSEAGGIPAERFVTLRKAMELASEGGDAGLMLSAVGAMGTAEIDINVLNVKANVLNAFAAKTTDSVRMKSLVESTLSLVDEALAGERYDVAIGALNAADAAAKRRAGLPYRKQLAERRAEVQELGNQLQALQQARVTIQTNPDDPAANTALGRWYCFAQNDWRRGLPMLAKGSDAELCQAALYELGPPTTKTMVVVGDTWWDQAQKASGKAKENLTLRSGYWYDQVHAKLPPGIVKTKIGDRLAEIAEIQHAAAEQNASDRIAEVQPGSVLPQGMWVDLLKIVREGGDWTRSGGSLVVNTEKWRTTNQLPVHVMGELRSADRPRVEPGYILSFNRLPS